MTDTHLSRRHGALPDPGELTLSTRAGPPMPPGWLIRALMGFRRWLNRVSEALAPPELVLFERLQGMPIALSIGLVARHRVADTLGNGRSSAQDLAATLKLNPDALHRVLRALASVGVFTLHADGTFSNNRLSQALRGGSPPCVRESAVYLTSGSNLTAWGNLEHTLKTGGSAFDDAHGQSVWDWFDAFPDERTTFATAMMGGTLAQAGAIAGLYPFATLQQVCDVGGGRGTLLSELLIRFPSLKGTLCDRPGVLELAPSFLQARGVADRVTLAPGDFFKDIVKGQQCYLLKNILHDWSDAESLTILKAVRAAAEKGARVLIFDFLQPQNGLDPITALADAHMMTVCTGRERSREEFARLLTEAGFDVGAVVEHPVISLIEGVAR